MSVARNLAALANEFLERHGVIEAGARPWVRYGEYDWTIHTGMYRDANH